MTIVRIAISDPRPSAYLRDIIDFDGEGVARRRLASCLISEAATQAMLGDDYDAFVRARSETLHGRALALAGETP